jgi:hypothetical protein
MEKNRAEQPGPQKQNIDWEQWGAEFAPQPVSDQDRLLTEIDHLNAHRSPDGKHSPWVLDEQLKNLISATKEAAMPYAVTRTEHPYEETGERDEQGRPIKAFMWLGKTAVENAMSGYRYHRHDAARRRVAIEVDEAHSWSRLQPGRTKIFISPRMTRADASLEDAKAEHLAHDDAVRITETLVDEQGNTRAKAMESLLFRNIPLEAWTDFLEDPDNLFGKSIQVRRDGSAASVMEVHSELEVDSRRLENGVISVVEAVMPYIQDQEARASAEAQLERFYESQGDMHAKAVNIAGRWQEFEIGLADSLQDGRATPEIEDFIDYMLPRWNAASLEVIAAHERLDGSYAMSRELAALLEKAKQNLLWTRAGVVTGNDRVLAQLDDAAAEALYRDEMFIQTAVDNGRYHEVKHLEVRTDLNIASANIGVGGGCAGENEGDFEDNDSPWGGSAADTDNPFSESKVGKVSKGKCIIEGCPTRPNSVLVGGCGICLGRCQKLFDQGKDPTKMNAARQQAGEAATQSFFSFEPPEPARQEAVHA